MASSRRGSLVRWGAIGLSLLVVAPVVVAVEAELDPASPAYRARFLAAYGVNGAIEPQLTQADRDFYQELLPLVHEDATDVRRRVEVYLRGNPAANPVFHFLVGSLDYQANQMESAAAHLEAALLKHPDYRRAHRILALIRLQEEEVAAGVPHLLAVIKLGGGDAQSYGLLGYAYLRMEKYRSALVAYQNARMFAPDSHDFRRGEAQCLVLTGQSAQALALYDELLAEQPERAELWLLSANACLALENQPRAVVSLEMARGLGANEFSNLMLLANLYFEDDMPGLGVMRAQEAMQSAVATDFAAAVRPLEFLVQRDLLDEAATYADTLGIVFADSLSAVERHRMAESEALIDFGLGRDDQGMDRLQLVLEEDPLHGRALILLGRRLMARGEHEQAEFYFERASAVVAWRAEALVELGQLAVERGDFPAALASLREAQQLRPRENVRQYLVQLEHTARNVVWE